MRTGLACGTLVALVLATAAHAAELAPGTYLTEGGWGELSLRSDAGGLGFEIATMGANAHSCGLAGGIRAGKAELDAGEGQSCRLEFVADAEGIEVKAHADDFEQCRYFCGARAGFEGRYLVVPPDCLPAAVQATRDRFKQLYDQRRYAPAVLLLEELLPRCQRVLVDIDQGWIESDLAIARLRKGAREACRAALAGRTELAAMSEDEISEAYPPVEAELYTRLAKAVRTNLRLCAEPAAPAGG